MSIVLFIIACMASIIGSISGIGGGIIIKPLLDALTSLDVSVISFLSGCTVLSMSIMTLIRSRKTSVKIDKVKGTYLALGGVVGGLVGKYIFDLAKAAFGQDAVIGATQSIMIIIMCIGVALYVKFKESIKTHQINNIFVCLGIGAFLGCLSAFLGIGGGPINIALLGFCFSMDTKVAAINSIYIIFFSQLSSLIFTITSGTVPAFEPLTLILMIIGGISGALIGSKVSQKLSVKGVDKLFLVVLGVIILISIYNTVNYIAVL